MGPIYISPERFLKDLNEVLNQHPIVHKCRMVVGPGRSGAIASVYASHLLNIPWLPYGAKCPEKLQPLLVIDTAILTGKTIRKCESKYNKKGIDTVMLWVYNEPPIVRFWYEGIYTNE